MADFDRLIIRRKRIDLSVARSLKEQAITFTHCRIDASSNAATASLRLHSTDNEPVTIFNGRRLKNFQVDKLYIDNTVQAGEWIDLIFWGGPVMGPPEINDDALTAQIAGAIQIDDSDPVNVDVITLPDPLNVRSLAGKEFMGGANKSAVASQYSAVQLLNPAASGIIISIRKIVGYTSAANGALHFRQYDTLLTAAGTGFNKNHGAAVSKGLIKTGSNASLLGTQINVNYRPSSWEPISDTLNNAPYILGEGEGIIMQGSVVNMQAVSFFEWSEN